MINIYKIQIKTFQNNILSFTVDNYNILEGDFIEFYDKIKGKTKRFHTSQAEIEVVDDE